MATEVQYRSAFDALARGRNQRLVEEQARQRNALGQLELQQAQQINSLANDPNATPDQYARLGRTDIANSLSADANRKMELEAGQKKQLAAMLVQASQYALKSQNPKAFIEQNYPQIAQLAGPEWATADDNTVRAKLQDTIGRFGPVAGIGPPAEKAPSLITGIGPDGKPVRVEDKVGVTPYERPRSGTTIDLPDGTSVQIGGDGRPNYGGVGLSKPNQNKLQEAFINAQGNAYALTQQLSKYRDEFSTLGGRAKAAIAGAKDYVGMENAPQQQQFLNDFTSWKSDTSALLSQYLNQLSGAAISPAEEARLKAGFPNADDPPSVYKSKADATLRRFALVQARAAYLLSTGNNKLDSVSLEGMQNIVLTEANKLAKSYEKAGMSADQAKARAISETKNRFGMGQ